MRCSPEVSCMTNIGLLTKLGLNYGLQNINNMKKTHISEGKKDFYRMAIKCFANNTLFQSHGKQGII